MDFLPRHENLALRSGMFLAIVVTFLSHSLLAEVVHVRDYRTHEAKDRGVLFALALTPQQDVLTLVAKKDEKWRLTRIQRWLDRKPQEESIEVPGLATKDFAIPDGPWYAKVLLTPDGRFAVCISSGHGIIAYGERGIILDDIVTVVDLRDFSVVTFSHTPAAPEEMHTFNLDDGRLLRMTAEAEGNSQWVTMSLPSLQIVDQGQNPPTVRPRNSRPQVLPESQTAKRSPECTSSELTGDGKFSIEYCGNRRQRWTLVHSLKTGKVDRIKQARRDSSHSSLANYEGRDFLLFVEGGTKLKVYELKE